MLAFFRAQRPPYLPAHAAIAAGPGGESVLTVEFAAPAPLGLLQPQSLPDLNPQSPQGRARRVHHSRPAATPQLYMDEVTLGTACDPRSGEFAGDVKAQQALAAGLD